MVEIRAFDVSAATPEDWTAIHAFRRARSAEESPGEPVLDDAEWERGTRQEWPLWQDRTWHAWNGGEIVGVAGESFRRPDAADYAAHAAFAHAWLYVLARERRQGAATQLLRVLRDFMRERGQTTANLAAHARDGVAFADAVGAKLKHRQIENRAPFATTDWAMLERWRDGVKPLEPALRWEVYPHRPPLDRVATLLTQFSALQADMPSGELDGPRVMPEMPAWRKWHAELDRSGGDDILVLLMEGETVAALCEACFDARFPDRVFQLLTAVAPSWRGRGLAKAVKAETMQIVRERHPDISFVSTSNANVNAPMLAINSQLGFVQHREMKFYQLNRDALDAYLSRRSTR